MMPDLNPVKLRKDFPRVRFLVYSFLCYLSTTCQMILYISLHTCLLTTVFHTGSNNPANHSKSDVCQLQTWSECNMLFFNAKKCEYLILKELYKRKINENGTDDYTDLGLVMNGTTTWRHDYLKLMKSIRFCIEYINSVKAASIQIHDHSIHTLRFKMSVSE